MAYPIKTSSVRMGAFWAVAVAGVAAGAAAVVVVVLAAVLVVALAAVLAVVLAADGPAGPVGDRRRVLAVLYFVSYTRS
jgi:hypothetical protein